MTLTEMFTICDSCAYAPCLCGNDPENCVAYVMKRETATVKCARGKRGRPSHEWNDGEKDRIYCLGWVDPMTDAPLPECVACPDFVDKAQDDLEAFYGREKRT